MAQKKTLKKTAGHGRETAFERAVEEMRGAKSPPPTVSARWLVTAAAVVIVLASVCAWGTLCLLYWQGSWQLLYHPSAAVVKTPASAGLGFDSVAFATPESGQPRLKGWWIPAEAGAKYSWYTVLYLHRQDGNMGDTVKTLAALHSIGLNVFTFDYRGYGQSEFARPSEARWREDAGWALEYLTGTRHIGADSILVAGKDLGANLALAVGAEHGALAGVIVETPIAAAEDVIFKDARSGLVPAHLLVKDRYDLGAPAAGLRLPSLWFFETNGLADAHNAALDAYNSVIAMKMEVFPANDARGVEDYTTAIARWLDELPAR